MLKPGECRIDHVVNSPFPYWVVVGDFGPVGYVLARCRTFCAAKRYAAVNGRKIVAVPDTPVDE